MRKIAALLTVHNRKDKTINCLKNLLQQELPEGYTLSIYMTDDGCTDGTQCVIREMYPQVTIISGDGSLFWNRGMWTAWNYAAQEYKYDYYLWLNDDTDLRPMALSLLLESAFCNNNETIVVGATVDTKTHKQLTYGGRMNDGTIPPCGGVDIEIHHFNGNIVLIPDFVYQKLGNLDYYFTHSKGDFDYGMRARNAGIKILQCGVVLGECDNHPVTDSWCDPRLPLYTRWRCMMRPNGMPPKETFYLNKRHYGLISAIKAYFSIYFRCLCPLLWIKTGKMELK